MIIIPYVRFIWATLIILNFVRHTNFHFSESFEVPLAIIRGIISIFFSGYCIIIGIQEVKTKMIIEAKVFESLGLIIEVLIFLVGLFVIPMFLESSTDVWRLGLLIGWQLGLLLLIVVDFTRIRFS